MVKLFMYIVKKYNNINSFYNRFLFTHLISKALDIPDYSSFEHMPLTGLVIVIFVRVNRIKTERVLHRDGAIPFTDLML